MNIDASHTQSLSEVHASVDPSSRGKRWKRIAAFFGPAYLVSVGYMDPGNWATDLAGGSQFGYQLIWVLVMSNLMALLLQSLSARLGIVARRDLAQCNREVYPKWTNYALYILAELAIAACDLAEVLGMAIGLNLLLGIPLIWGVGITLLDTILLLYLQKLGMRRMEAFIIALVGIIGVSFLAELIFAKPDLAAIAGGLKPRIENKTALYIAIGIIGATVMPHNLYLHSALVQTRLVRRDPSALKKAIRYNTWDSVLALNMALFVNAAILILAAAAFYKNGLYTVASLKDAHQLLNGLLGSKWSSHLFAIALIAAGQSSTITGTLAGQVVMEGYLRLRINPWIRRLMTRLVAIVPAVLVIWIAGDEKVDDMLVFSQVLLSMQLAFAVIPLIHFVSNKERMGQFAIGAVAKSAAWVIATIIVSLNIYLLWLQYSEANFSFWASAGIIVIAIAVAFLLILTIAYPLYRKPKKQDAGIHLTMQKPEFAPVDGFMRIAVAVDYTEKDECVLKYARQLANQATEIVLIHVVESATARTVGEDSDDFETLEDRKQLEAYARIFRDAGFEVTTVLGFRYRAKEIARIVNRAKADLLVVGSHGHQAISDWLFGETINSVRHMLNIPIFIAR